MTLDHLSDLRVTLLGMGDHLRNTARAKIDHDGSDQSHRYEAAMAYMEAARMVQEAETVVPETLTRQETSAPNTTDTPDTTDRASHQELAEAWQALHEYRRTHHLDPHVGSAIDLVLRELR